MLQLAQAGVAVVKPLSSAFLFLVCGAGCFGPGRIMTERDFEYRNPAVKWVYESGWQIGLILWAPTVHQNGIFAQPGEGCVIVQEMAPGCIAWGPWRPVYALSLDDGHLIFGERSKEGPPFVFIRDDLFLKSGTGGNRIELICPAQGELEIQSAAGVRTRLLKLRVPKSGFRHFSIDHAFLTQHELVAAGFYGYVLCVDIERLGPEWASTDTQASTETNSE